MEGDDLEHGSPLLEQRSSISSASDDISHLLRLKEKDLEDVVPSLESWVRRHKSATFSLMTICVFVVLLVSATSSLFYHLGRQTRDATPQITWKHCGNSSEEAKSLGCVLDLIDRAWIPAECHDDQLMDEFLHQKDWKWYEDMAMTKEIPYAVIADGGGPSPAFVSDDYHWYHCAYMWRKMHRALHHNKPMDSHLDSWKHTKHCSQDLLEHNPGVPLFYLMYLSCPVATSY